MQQFQHETVLLDEAVDGLAVKDGTYVDCTLGGGGHSEAILQRLNGAGHVYAFDQDKAAIQHAQQRLSSYHDAVTFIHANFAKVKEKLSEQGVSGVDGILFDLGVSSPQFDQADRGFSYRFDAPLDMRMDQTQALTAREIINEWSFQDLAYILSRYGEEKFAKQIARKIEAKRAEEPIETTFELNDIIKEAIPAPARRKGGHPSKRTFQAVRMAVNDELEMFERALQDAISLLNSGGRICVITFHSLEDRLCKQVFKKESSLPDLPKGLPVIPEESEPLLKLITKKPMLASEPEVKQNHRAHSAKLRIAEKR
ncbi:16S rRNA (cytosine1402-N4)-methyltransferase [Alteribacillus persepolensis]|uniref:Ribosomal RNA small subunit methyltransferase H n=1 Tax=Alteribacillus persepolensis TaxID=568899 RepID=A0A1G7YEB2_9BACI|nr:16S rRNA (cytosine(1402)-N(4))-methyltransferase RsmH [Alteribacillus persepolensis]SDG94892.1 16S rRNA (cytosine1402-N4)-methyltransferase [Alteribacillus persepolensis]